MTYSNPLSSRLALQDDDLKMEGKLLRLCADLEQKILTPIPDAPFQWHVQRADIATDAALAADWRKWERFGSHSVWAKKQGHTWFAAEVTVPEAAAGQTLVLKFHSQWQDRPGTTDPQCLAYLDGKIAQALDGNHTELVVARKAKPGSKHVLQVNAFTFFDRPLVGFTVEFFIRNERAEKLYYDLQTPLDVAIRLHQSDPRRHAIMSIIERALPLHSARPKGSRRKSMRWSIPRPSRRSRPSARPISMSAGCGACCIRATRPDGALRPS
jgi:alpha-mannosidase